MQRKPLPTSGATPAAELISDLEAALAGVHEAMALRDSDALERHSLAVQRLMAAALEQARRGQLQPEARQRLAQVGARLAAQRASLSRATAAFDRAIDALMPAETLGLYGESGRALKRRSSGDSVSA